MTIEIDIQNKEVEKSFWDGQSQDFRYKSFEKKVYSAFRVPEYIDMIRLVNSTYPLHSRCSIVDIGCSAGVSSITLSTLGFSVTGLDISEGLIDQARTLALEEGSDVSFITGDAAKLPFENASIDVCFMVGLLHHFPNYLPVLKDIHRILNTGGIIIAIEPNALNLSYRLSFRLVQLIKGVTENEYPLSPFRLKQEFNSIFDQVSIIPFRVDDVPFLRQLGYLGKGLCGRLVKTIYLQMRKLFTPKILQGTFFIAVGKKI